MFHTNFLLCFEMKATHLSCKCQDESDVRLWYDVTVLKKAGDNVALFVLCSQDGLHELRKLLVSLGVIIFHLKRLLKSQELRYVIREDCLSCCFFCGKKRQKKQAKRYFSPSLVPNYGFLYKVSFSTFYFLVTNLIYIMDGDLMWNFFFF